MICICIYVLVCVVYVSVYVYTWASKVMLAVKNLPASAGDMRHVGLIPGSGRSFGGGHGKTHSSILTWRIPIGRGAWKATVHGVAKSQT